MESANPTTSSIDTEKLPETNPETNPKSVDKLIGNTAITRVVRPEWGPANKYPFSDTEDLTHSA